MHGKATSPTEAGQQLARRSFVVTGAMLLMALIMVAERSGLPRETAAFAALWLLAATLIFGALGHRTTTEDAFAGSAGAWAGGMPAIAIGAGLFAGVDALIKSTSMTLYIAQGLGCVAGVVAAHVIARQAGPRRGTEEVFIPAAMLGGLGALALGLTVGTLALTELLRALLALHLPIWLVMTLALGCPVAAIAIGGAQGALGLAAVAALLAGCGFALIVGIGVMAHGAPPLPGVAEPATLLAISEARVRWLPADAMPPFSASWPSLEAFLSGEAPAVFGLSALTAMGLSHMLAGSAGLRRRGRAATVAITAAATPVLLIAAGGFAIEAAGVAFVGASGQRPPAALVEMARQGLVEVCAARPATGDALRLACGFPVRGESAIGAELLRFAGAFLPGGGPMALGFGSAVDLLSRAAAPLLSMIALILALACGSLGLGRDILGKGRRDPGQASLRLALIRLSALLLVIALSFGFSLAGMLEARLPYVAAGGAALVIVASLGRRFARRSSTLRAA